MDQYEIQPGDIGTCRQKLLYAVRKDGERMPQPFASLRQHSGVLGPSSPYPDRRLRRAAAMACGNPGEPALEAGEMVSRKDAKTLRREGERAEEARNSWGFRYGGRSRSRRWKEAGSQEARKERDYEHEQESRQREGGWSRRRQAEAVTPVWARNQRAK